MRFVRTSLLFLLLLLIMSRGSSALAFGCTDLLKSSKDTLFVPFFAGVPGDTVLMPVFLKNDSIVTSFQFLIEYDTTWLTPVFIRDSTCAVADNTGCLAWSIDTSFVDHSITGRMVIEDVSQGPFGPVVDTINQFTVNLFEGRRNVLACNMIPEFLKLDSLPPGNDTIFYVKFVTNPAMPHGTLSQFTFYESDIFIVNDTVFPPDTTFFNGCNESQMVATWDVAPDSTENFQLYPTTNLGFGYFFRADTAYVPPGPAPTVTFSANPSTISTSQSTSLIWTSTLADSVVLRDGSGNRMAGASNGATAGSISFSSGTEGTFNFSATGYGSDGQTTTKNAIVTVNTGSGGGTGPTISLTGLLGSYNQGEQVSFTVTASNTDGSQITITASSLPSNATFGTGSQVVGLSPLNGNFSWTPDFNQSGLFAIRITATDAQGSSFRDVNIQINELQFDRLFSTSRPGSKPVGGLPGTRSIAFPIDLVTSQTVYGVQFDIRYPSNVIKIDSFVTTARIPEYVVYDNIGQTPGNVRVVTLGLSNEPVIDTNTTAILQAMLTLDSSAITWFDYAIYLENGRESVNPDPGVGSLPLVTDSGLVTIDSLGDVNLDKFIDVDDVVGIVASIIGNFTLTLRQFATADIVTDSAVNVFDLVADVNMIYNTPLPSPPAPGMGPEAVMTLAYGDIPQGSSDLLTVKSDIPEEVAGVQLELDYNPSALSFGVPHLTDDNANFSLQYKDDGIGRMKVLLYNIAPAGSGNFINPGLVDFVNIPIHARSNIKEGDKGQLRLTEALLSTSGAAAISVQGVDAPLPTDFSLSQNYPNPFNPTTTIEFQLTIPPSGEAQQDVRLDIFNILGQQVTTLLQGSYPPGLHRVVWDATDKQGHRIATGIYLYRLIVGDEQKTKKMLFLK